MFTYPGGFDPSAYPEPFSSTYRSHLQHLKLKGLQPKTIDAYARTIRRMGGYFDHQIDNLSPAQLSDYFHDLVAAHSWSAVKLDLYGFKFYSLHVLRKPWPYPTSSSRPARTTSSCRAAPVQWRCCTRIHANWTFTRMCMWPCRRRHWMPTKACGAHCERLPRGTAICSTTRPWPRCFGPSFWPPWLKRGCRCRPTFPMRTATSAARINLIASVPTGCCGGARPKTVPLG